MKKYRVLFFLLIAVLALTACSGGTTETEEPQPSASRGFAWEVRDGLAYLIGIGDVTDADIVIPDQVRLVETAEGWTEASDDASGTLCQVIVKGDAFANCDTIQTVTFHRGVQTENNQMRGSRLGMFYQCGKLTAVYNIPDGVTAMKGTFVECESLVTVQGIPDSVTDMRDCFRNCASLTDISNFPAMVSNLDNCFEGCQALQSVPELPDSVTSMDMCFMDCTQLRTAPRIPDQVKSLHCTFFGCTSLAEAAVTGAGVENMSSTFAECTSLARVTQLPVNVKRMDGCFVNCASLTQVCDVPETVVSMNECFLGCKALTMAPRLPNSVLYMMGCFQYCESLTEVTDLPDNVEDLSRCFAECSALLYSPEIPESVKFMNFCFYQCDSLQGTVTIPQVVATTGGIFCVVDCPNVESVVYDTCTYVAKNTILRYYADSFRPHTESGTCEYCGQTDKLLKDYGMQIVIDGASEYYEKWFIEFIENEVPQFFKDDCEQITLTADLTRYSDSDYIHKIAGIAGADIAYIKTISDMSQLPEVIFHELAHCYDYVRNDNPVFTIKKDGNEYIGSSAISGTHVYSQSEEWIALHEAEGNTASWWYDAEMYESFTEEKRRLETFAIAVGKYFTDPYALKSCCPGMYAYVDNIFRPLLEAEAAAKEEAENPA